MSFTQRTEYLVGTDGLARLRAARVLVVGVGGVGSHAAEALARAGIGHLCLVDDDAVVASNLNRQIQTLQPNLGQAKVEAMAQRIKAIDPSADIAAHNLRFGPDTADELLEKGWDFVVDAIDTVSAKLHLIECCVNRRLPLVSSMGAAWRLDPSRIQMADLYESRGCPLARIIRKKLRKRGVHAGIQVVYSDEDPVLPHVEPPEEDGKRPHGTVSYMPAIFGNMCAATVIDGLLKGIRLKRRGRVLPSDGGKLP